MIDDGNGWSAPIQLTSDTGRVEQRPATASLSATEWVVAWQRTPIDDSSTTVRYAIVDSAGDVQRTEEIAPTMSPAVARTADGVALAYHDPETGEVRREAVTADGRSSVDSYSVAAVTEVTVGPTATSWLADPETAGTAEDPQLAYVPVDGTVETVPVPDAARSIRAPRLLETERGPAVVYQRHDDAQSFGTVAYQLRTGGRWLPPRSIGRASDADLDLGLPAVTTRVDSEGLTTAVSVRPSSDDGVGDIVVAAQPFRAVYGITGSAATTDIQPGTDVSIDYTLENVGEMPGTESVRVEARSQDETLATADEDPLEPGASTTGSLTVQLDTTGTVTLTAGSNLADHSPEGAAAVVVVSTPNPTAAPSADPLSVERADETTATVTVPIRNDGPIAVGPLPIEVTSGTTTLGTTTVDGVPAGETVIAAITFNPRDVQLDGSETITLDPELTLPDAYFAPRETPVLVGQPSVRIDDRVEYFRTTAGIVAELLVTSEGPIKADGRVLALEPDATTSDGSYDSTSVYGTAAVTVPAAIDTDQRARRVVVPLGDIEPGTDVELQFDSARASTITGVSVVDDVVEPVFEGTDLQAVRLYTNENDVVDADELRTAIDDWRNADIDTGLLRDVIDYWRSGEPVE